MYLKEIKIWFINGEIEEHLSIGNKEISIDHDYRCVEIKEYRKKGHEGQVIVRTIPFEQIKETEGVR